MESYTLHLRKIQIYLTIMAPIFMFLLILTVILSFFFDKNVWGIGFVSLSIIIAFLNWKRYLYKPIEIEVSNNNAIFRDIFRKETEISLTDILKIEVDNSKALKIISKRKEIVGVFAFNNFEKFVSDIKNSNPSLITIGF